jgi:nanoRNase/pAp phosphatase (c-di-AMP/oligoRNAs hydrolase)
MDSWHWKYEEETKSFISGMESFPTEPDDYIWRSLYEKPYIKDDVIKDGRAISRFLSARNEQRVKTWGFIAKIDEYETIVSNDRGGSLLFGDKAKEFPLVCTFIHDGENFNVSLYSTQINVRQIAEKYGEQSGLGGGGHDGAAGFRCKELPFTDICPLSM